jgi:cell shape-determining protein MreC
MRKYSQDMQMLSDLETDHLDIAKLREQRQLVARVQAALLKKDQEIEQFKALLQKYQQYQQKYASLKVELTERQHLMSEKESECKMLRKQMEDLLREQA